MPTEKVVLKQPHTHAGIAYDAGESIEVTPTEARWLLDHKVIDRLDAEKPVKPTK